MSDRTRSTTVRYETSAQEQTSVVRTRTICTLNGARSDLPKQGIFPTVWSETVLRKVPHFDLSLPVDDRRLLLRCFLLFRVADGRAGVYGPFAAELLEPVLPSPRALRLLGARIRL